MKKADISPKALIRKLHHAGWSINQLSLAHGYKGNALNNALAKPWPKAEKIIAKALGVNPEELWPSRYIDGEPARKLGRPKIRPQNSLLVKTNYTRASKNNNVNVRSGDIHGEKDAA